MLPSHDVVARPSQVLNPRSIWSGGLSALVIAALVTAVYWPGVHGFWGRDDFAQLAFSRLIGSPWPLFVQDHFPVPGALFRPLGFASMWLCQVLFGNDYAEHAIADLALHIGVSLMLLALLRRAAVPPMIALICSLLFALHPAVIGTALWWSARFDLLASLFILLALLAAFDYRERQRWFGLPCVLLAALAAMLSKEIGFALIGALSLLWIRWIWIEPTQRTKALQALVLTWLVALVYLLWRWWVLGTLSSGLAGATPISGAIAHGLLDWLQQAPGYWTFWIRLEPTQRVMLAAALCLLLASLVAACMFRYRRLAWQRYADLALCGLSLLLLPALLQAPVAALNAAPLGVDVSVIETAMQSRLYYLGLAGGMCLLAAVLAVILSVTTRKVRVMSLVALGLVASVFAWVAQHNAQAFALRAVDISTVARQAIVAVGKLDLPKTDCHVVFLDVEPAPEWSIYVSMDSIVKALSPDLARVQHCYFHANYVTYFYLLGAPGDPNDVAPYRPKTIGENVSPWRRIGDLTIAYLLPPQNSEASSLAKVQFLRYRDGDFEDVSAEVVAGRLSVRMQ